jgi:segregation and condensation protein B
VDTHVEEEQEALQADVESGVEPNAESDAESEVNLEANELHAAAKGIEPAVEALLFVASEPLEPRRISKLTGEDERVVALALQALEERYSDGGIVLRQIAGGYRFATSSAVRGIVEAYLLPPKTTLSTPALETLAIVANLQPVTKSEIEAIRGVNSDSVVNTLLEKNLIAEAGRKDVVGRPMTYKTTPLFLESFGLRSLDDLPQPELEPGQPLELNLLLPQQAAEETDDDVRQPG